MAKPRLDLMVTSGIRIRRMFRPPLISLKFFLKIMLMFTLTLFASVPRLKLYVAAALDARSVN